MSNIHSGMDNIDIPKFNLSCISILPCFMSLGLGQYVIQASYRIHYHKYKHTISKKITELTDKTLNAENKNCTMGFGTPERPLSDKGKRAYYNYWYSVVLKYIKTNSVNEFSNNTITIKDISINCGIEPSDLIELF